MNSASSDWKNEGVGNMTAQQEQLLAQSRELHLRAEKVLAASGVLEAWATLGAEVRYVGSFRSDLMMRDRDIDMHVYTKELDVAETLRAFTPLLAKSSTRRLTYVNGADTDEFCLEWHLRSKDEEGELWTFDMIQILAGSRLDGHFEAITEAIANAVTSETKLAILELKSQTPQGMNPCGICSMKQNASSEYSLRPSTREEIPVLTDLSKQAFDTDIMVGAPGSGGPPGYDSPKWHLEMLNDGHLFSFFECDQLIGGAVLFEDTDNVTVGRIFLSPALFRTGRGIRLMESIRMRDSKKRPIHLDTPVWNTRTIAFYKRCGFTEVGRDAESVYFLLDFKKKKTRMETQRLILRSWKDEDAEALYGVAKDPDVGPIAGWPPHRSVEDSRNVIRNVFHGAECYAICEQGTDRPIGCIELKLNGRTPMTNRADECELGYWLGKPFWGRGYMPEAAREVIRHAFCDLGMRAIWCGYYEGNDKSKRVQEKVGFVYRYTKDDVSVPLMGEVRMGHTNILTKEQWKASFSVVSLKERADLKDKAAAWFSSMWGIPVEAYRESIEASFSSTVPSWYLCLDGDRIAGGLGVIENDFHNRKDLTPNVCAVYTVPDYRSLGIAGRLLDFVCADMAAHGIGTLYLLTDHTGFYERYGWKYLCPTQFDGETEPSRMYVHDFQGSVPRKHL